MKLTHLAQSTIVYPVWKAHHGEGQATEPEVGCVTAGYDDGTILQWDGVVWVDITPSKLMHDKMRRVEPVE